MSIQQHETQEPNSTANLNILIVEDHSLVGEGLRMLLESTPGLHVAGLVGAVSEALDFLASTPVDVLLLDLRLNGKYVFEDISTITAFAPDVRILVVTAQTSPEVHRQALERGAAGVFMKFDPASLITTAIEQVARGEVWVGRALASEILNNIRNPAHAGHENELLKRLESLTPRERDIIKCLSSGVTNKGIADMLGINERSVRNSLSTIFDKLLVKNRLELLLLSTKYQLDGNPTPRYDRDPEDE